MSEEERKLVDDFLDIAKANNFSYNVVFAMGAVAFDKGTTEQDSIEILKCLINLAAKYPNEADFLEEVGKRFIG